MAFTWQDKHTYGVWGAIGGAAALAIIGFTWGDWHTSKGAAARAGLAVLASQIPGCVKDVMGDPTSAAELKTKRPTDYDDVVRDFRKRDKTLSDLGYQFHRDCGKAIEAKLAQSPAK